MNMAILYIGTGKYEVFWQGFFDSCEELFCNDANKHYFVFTDSTNIKSNDKITVIYLDNLGWPFNALLRYRMLLRIEEQLRGFDYNIFFNGNCIFKEKIYLDDIVGDKKQYTLISAKHPGYYNKTSQEFPYEDRDTSLAKVNTPHYYFAGAINGGVPEIFLNVIKEVANNIEQDLNNGIVSKWHEESHWNAYLNNNFPRIELSLKILSADYLYPQGWILPFKAKILLRDKNEFGGRDFMRGISRKQNMIEVILNRVRNKIYGLKIYFRDKFN